MTVSCYFLSSSHYVRWVMNHCTSAARNYITSPSNKHTFFYVYTQHVPSAFVLLSILIGFLRNVLQRDDWKSYFLNCFFPALEIDIIDHESISSNLQMHPIHSNAFHKTRSTSNRSSISRLHSLIRNLSEIYRKLTSLESDVDRRSRESSGFERLSEANQFT